MTFTDQHGHRFQRFITNQADPDIVWLKSATASMPGWRTASAALRPGLRNLPCYGFAANDARLTLVACAQTLVCWTQALCLSGELARRARHAPLPAVAHRRAAGPPRPPAPAPPATHLAVGAGTGGRVRAVAGPAGALLTLPTPGLLGIAGAADRWIRVEQGRWPSTSRPARYMFNQELLPRMAGEGNDRELAAKDLAPTTGQGLVGVVRKHPVASFSALTYLFSWG
jgi:hypothetical protein